MGGVQGGEPAFDVRVVWPGGTNESRTFYGPDACKDATEHYKELKRQGGFQSLSLNRFDGSGWVVVEQTEPEGRDQAE
jgi:hypothetical protein